MIVYNIAFSPDASKVVYVGYEFTKVIDTRSCKVLLTVDDMWTNRPYFSNDGKYLLLSGHTFPDRAYKTKFQTAVYDGFTLKKKYALRVNVQEKLDMLIA